MFALIGVALPMLSAKPTATGRSVRAHPAMKETLTTPPRPASNMNAELIMIVQIGKLVEIANARTPVNVLNMLIVSHDDTGDIAHVFRVTLVILMAWHVHQVSFFTVQFT